MPDPRHETPDPAATTDIPIAAPRSPKAGPMNPAETGEAPLMPDAGASMAVSGGATETPPGKTTSVDAAAMAPRMPFVATDAGTRSSKLAPPPPPTGGAAPACRFHFCDSFEDGSDGASPPGWSKNANITLDATHVARGKKAVHVRTGGLAAGNLISRGGIFPPGKTTIFGRMFLWIDKRPQAGALVHWTLAEVRGSGGPTIRTLGGIAQNAFSGRNNLMFNIDPGGGERSTEDSFPFPIVIDKTWHCLEFMLTRGDKDESKIWWNEEFRPRLSYLGTWGPRFKFPVFSQLAIGFATYQNAGDFEVWIDELALDDQRLGCAP